MKVTVQHLGRVKFAARTRGHQVICDQPAANGGADQGMTPPEFLLISLGTCAGFYAAKYLETRSLSQEGLEIEVTAEKAANPARLGSFRIDVHAPGLPPHHEAGILRAVDACLIRNTLVNPPQIETVLHTSQEVPVA